MVLAIWADFVSFLDCAVVALAPLAKAKLDIEIVIIATRVMVTSNLELRRGDFSVSTVCGTPSLALAILPPELPPPLDTNLPAQKPF